jgi:hypothetical protein
MARYSLRRFGVNSVEAEAIAQGLRGRPVSAVLSPGASSGRAGIGGRLRTISERLTGRATDTPGEPD